MINLTPEIIAFLTTEALNQMVLDAKKHGRIVTHAEIIETVIADPKGTTALYMGKYIHAGIDGAEIAYKRYLDKQK